MATFFNQATLLFQGQVTNSNTTSGEVLDILGATKTALSADYGAQDGISYAISLVNSGPTAITNITLTDSLGAYTVGTTTVYPLDYIDGSVKLFVNGVLQTAPTVTAGPPLDFSGITVPAGGNALLVYEARTNEYAPLTAGSTIVNELTGSGGGACGAIAATSTIPVRAESTPTITKFASPDEVVCNGEITYTFILQNGGNREIVAGDNLAVTDTFNPILNITSVTLDDVAWTENTGYTYNPATGEFATVAGQIAIPAASYTQDPDTGVITTTPGVVVLKVTGTV